jgi:hypothetical protein
MGRFAEGTLRRCLRQDEGMDLLPISFECAACGETNEATADPSQGARQSYVEDCRVCCRANLLVVRIDRESGTAWAEAALEDG